MKDNISNGSLWNSAAKAGLVFGAISSVYIGVTELVKQIDSVVITGLLGGILWIGKVALCIWLMVFAMKKLTRKYSGVTNSDTFRFGVRTALLSAIIVAGAYAAIMVFMPSETMDAAFDTAIAQYSTMLDSNSMELLGTFKENMPVIMFFSELIYCFLFGLVLSLIVSRSVPSRNPFAREEESEEDNETTLQ